MKIAAYGEGALYPPGLDTNLKAIAAAGWTHLMLSLCHINADGDLFFNDTAIVVSGKYVADYRWIKGLESLASPASGQAVQLLATFGGGGVGDFGNVKTIYQDNSSSFDGTNLETNFKALYGKIGKYVSIIDMDVEQDYDQTSFVAFCQMLIGIGYKITFCPYTYQQFWNDSLSALNTSNPGAVLWWNLQCYSGGSDNDPKQWAASISQAISGFDTTGFILVSDTPKTASCNGDDPTELQSTLASYSGEACVGGAFLWTLDTILDNTVVELNPRYPMSQYTQAIQSALGS